MKSSENSVKHNIEKKRNLCIVISAHQCYIRHEHDAQRYGAENNMLFESISNVYLPLLNSLNEAEENGLDCKISLVVSPILCELLTDSVIREQYIDWLDRRILLGESEMVRLQNDGELQKVALRTTQKAKKDKADFTEKYSRGIIKEIARLSEKGKIELLATCGTYSYLPHYADLEEVVCAQIESGLHAHKRFFGHLPDGFFLPYLGYAPGIERLLRAYGMNYTIIDSRSLFFSPDGAGSGIFEPVRGDPSNPLAFFATDPNVLKEIESFSTRSVFRAVSRDIGFEVDSSTLSHFIPEGSPRIPTLFRYFAKDGKIYDEEKAISAATDAADMFLESRTKRLFDASNELSASATMVCVIDASLLGKTWEEGSVFFSELLKKSAEEKSIRLCGASDVLCDLGSDSAKLRQIRVYPSASTKDGFAGNLLDSSNAWMVRYTRKMCERMVDISDRFPHDTGLKIRLLNLGAKELLLSQDGEWARLTSENADFREYAEKNFRECIKAFIVVYDSLGSNTVSTEWLTRQEKRHPLFPWMNFRIFSPKK